MSDFTVASYNVYHRNSPTVIKAYVEKLAGQATIIGLQEMGSSHAQNAVSGINGWKMEKSSSTNARGQPIIWKTSVWEKAASGSFSLHGKVPAPAPNDGGTWFKNNGKSAHWMTLRRKSDNSTILFVNIHMIPTITILGRSRAFREGIQTLADWAGGRENIIIVGDFNANHDHPYLAPLRKAGLTNVFSYQSSGGTLGSRKIDHVWTFKEKLPVSALSVPSGYASDHRPVITTFGNFDVPTTEAGQSAIDILQEEAAEESGGWADEIETVDLSTRPFAYNPPLHKASLPARVDFAGNDPAVSMRAYLRESQAPKGYKDDWATQGASSAGDPVSNLQALRLGRIYQSKTGTPMHRDLAYRYGFRFLYNPNQVSIAASRNDGFRVDPKSEANRMISGIGGNFQQIQIELLLNRIPDVLSPDISASDYSPTLGPQDKKGIRTYGTHWDLEYLFLLCNGKFQLQDRGSSGNIGVLFPGIMRMSLGLGQDYYGFVANLSYTDVMFSPEMIPIRTNVSLLFQRNADFGGEEFDDFLGLLGPLATTEAGGDGDDDGGGSSGAGAPTGDAPTPSGSRTYEDPSIPHGGNAGGKVTNSTAYMFNQVWEKWGSGFLGAHCWRANGYGSATHPGGHACDFQYGGGAAQGSQKQHGDDCATWLVDNAENLGICYIIWYRRIWNKSTGWKAYSGANGNPNNDHTNHIHVTTKSDPSGWCQT